MSVHKSVYCDSLELLEAGSSLSLSSTGITANRTLMFDVGDVNRTLLFGGDVSLSGAVTTVGGFNLIFTQTANTNITLPTSGTIPTLAGSEVFTNKTMDDPTNSVTANSLRTPASSVSIDGNAPVAGSILIAISSTNAEWGANTGGLGISSITIASASSYNVLVTDGIIACRYSATGPQTITLPLTSSVTAGKTYHITDTDGSAFTNNITITASGSDSINGQATVAINVDMQSISVFSDGTNWFIY